MNTGSTATVLLALAIGFAVGAVIVMWRCCPLHVVGARATGTIERLVTRQIMVQDVRGAVPHPVSVLEAVIVFTTRPGETVRFRAGVNGAQAPGDRVPVRYNAARPTEAEIEAPSRPRLVAIGLAVSSGLLVLAAAIAMFACGKIEPFEN